MSKWVKLIAILIVATTVVSCSSRKKQETVVPVPIDDTGSSIAPTGTPGAIQSGFLDKVNSMGITNSGRYNWDDVLSNKTIYFEYDSSALDPESQLIVEAHGEYIASQGGTSFGLEGHTDERGTNEYNLALGERRAETVSNVMAALGASNANIVSYGEESPISEEYWKNRRVDLVY